jgi:hypothetical protein
MAVFIVTINDHTGDRSKWESTPAARIAEFADTERGVRRAYFPLSYGHPKGSMVHSFA